MTSLRQWFALDRDTRRERTETFNGAVRDLTIHGAAERAQGIDVETETFLALNHRVNELWQTVPVWVRVAAYNQGDVFTALDEVLLGQHKSDDDFAE